MAELIRATKNGHDQEFSAIVWDRMGTGNTRMGWTLASVSQTPPEVEVLKQKMTAEPEVVELKKKAPVTEETVVDEPEPAEEKKEEETEEKETKKPIKKKGK